MERELERGEEKKPFDPYEVDRNVPPKKVLSEFSTIHVPAPDNGRPWSILTIAITGIVLALTIGFFTKIVDDNVGQAARRMAYIKVKLVEAGRQYSQDKMASFENEIVKAKAVVVIVWIVSVVLFLSSLMFFLGANWARRVLMVYSWAAFILVVKAGMIAHIAVTLNTNEGSNHWASSPWQPVMPFVVWGVVALIDAIVAFGWMKLRSEELKRHFI